jgi:group I intron endonuclease
LTAFLGFFYIAQNGFYSIQQNKQKNKKKQVQNHYVKKNYNLFILNEVKILQGVRYYSTKQNIASCAGNNNCINNTDKFNEIYRSIKNDSFSFRNVSKTLEKFLIEKNLNPAFIYEDLLDDTIKSRVLNETRGLSGIYLILNKVTLDYYIGSASTGKIHARFSNHLFNFHGSKVVKNAVKKYGLSSFAFLVLELYPEIINKENNKKLLDLEDFYLKSLLPNYNILTEAGSSFGYKHTEITRLKMKTNYSEERRLAIGSLNKGKSLSASTIEAIRQSALNRIKPIYSEEAIQNMKKSSKAILVYNMDYTVYGEFSSIIEASKSLGCSPKTINRALRTPKKILRKRWIVKYI